MRWERCFLGHLSEHPVSCTQFRSLAADQIPLCSAKNTFGSFESFMPRFSPAGIRDAAHQEWISQRFGNLLEYGLT
jgi:hypothetical protein